MMKSGESIHTPTMFDVAPIPLNEYVPEVLPPNGEKLEITVDKDHATQVLDKLMEAYRNGWYPYNQERAQLPHDPRHMPETLERGSVDHGMFMFNICYYMRGGIKSNLAVQQMSKVYDKYPELFNCEYASGVNQATIEATLAEHGLGFQGTVAGQWIENSRRMLEKYDGDPRNIFNDVTTYEQCQELIQNQKGKGFIGFQEKMTSMVMYYFMDEGLMQEFTFPIPVDLHVGRVSIANEMITFGDAPYGTDLYKDETLAELRKLYQSYADERGISSLELCNAVWMLSESSCGRNPGNITKEPLGRKARDGRNTRLEKNVINIHDLSQRKVYDESCRHCPIIDSCKYNIPGKIYYVAGALIIRGEIERGYEEIPHHEPVEQFELFDI